MLGRRGNQAGINDLAATGEVAVAGQFAPHRLKNDFAGQDCEVNMSLQQLEHIAELVKLGFTLLGGKQAFFDHRGSV